ncbi:glycosyltransferase [Anseongella ginsenosidimutans]|nr:glycosyltransferase [Anseongella ginsenosidimutans]
MAHKLDFILECAAAFKGLQPFRFLFIGNGAEKGRLLEIKERDQLDNVTFLDSVDKNEIPRYLSIMDIALVPLKQSDTFKKVIPSKIFETAAMHIPIFLGVEGEARQLIGQYEAGFYFEPENSQNFIDQLSWYYTNRHELKSQYQAGCKRLAADFDRKRLAKNMFRIIQNTLNTGS